MSSVWLVLILSTLAALADTLGGALTVVKRLSPEQIAAFTSVGAGFLLGATLLDRLPNTLHTMPSSGPVYILLGYLLVFTLEMVRPKDPTSSDHPVHHHGGSTSTSGIALVSMLVHTFMDGVVIAGALEANRATGMLMFVAVTLHKIPEGLTISAISLASSTSRKRALLWSFMLTCSTIVGALVTLSLGALQGIGINVIMALATGTFLFISTSDLVPFVRTQKQPRNLFLLFLGCGVFYITLTLVKHVGLS